MSPKRKILRFQVKLQHLLMPAGSGPVYIFHHIPKTGGSSVNRMLPCWFYRVRDYPQRRDPNDWTLGHTARPPVDLSLLRRNDCLAGHWAVEGQYLHERYPQIIEDPRYQLFALVREPLDLKLSLYFWEGRQGKDLSRVTMEEELLSRPNFLARRFPCGENDYEEVLSRYFFIGLTDRLQESFDRLAGLLGKPRLCLPHVNRSRDGRESVELEESFFDEFRHVNRLDYLVYEHCVRRYETLGG